VPLCSMAMVSAEGVGRGECSSELQKVVVGGIGGQKDVYDGGWSEGVRRRNLLPMESGVHSSVNSA
jgi:hypothetical protein